jgi:hypothetical protein
MDTTFNLHKVSCQVKQKMKIIEQTLQKIDQFQQN